jgi:PAS domain S-box-containing protein
VVEAHPDVPLRRPFLTALVLCTALAGVVAFSSMASELVGMLWLPSGAATVLSALGGQRARLGAVTAVVLVDLVWMPQVVQVAPGVLALILLGIALGTYAQLVVAGRLMAPSVTQDGAGREVSEPRSIARFLLAAVLPGAFSAALFTAILPLSGRVDAEDLPVVALLWWLGDASAALVAAPAVAAFFGRPANHWRPRRTATLLGAVIGWSGLTFTFGIIDAGRRSELASEWQEYSDELGNLVFNTIENAAELAHGLSSAAVVAAEFDPPQAEVLMERFAVAQNTGEAPIELLAWAPRTAAGYRLRLGTSGPEARPWRGLALDATPDDRERLGLVVAAGQPRVFPTPPALARGDVPLIAIYAPVYRGGGVPEAEEDRHRLLLGLVVALVEAPLVSQDGHVHPQTISGRLVVTDRTTTSAVPVLDREIPTTVPPDRVHWLARKTPVDRGSTSVIYGRLWHTQVTGVVVTSLFEPLASWVVAVVIAGLLAALLDALVLLVTGRESLVREVVARRTLALESIREVQGRFIAGSAEPAATDVAPLLAAVRAVTGARAVDLERCATCRLEAPSPCTPAPDDVSLPLRHGETPLGCLHIHGMTRPEGLDDARALAGTAASVLGASAVATARREAEARFDAFMAHLPVVVVMKSRDGRFVYVNPACERTLLPPGVTAVGKRNADLFPAEVAAHLETIDARLWRSGEPLAEAIVIDRPGGRVHLQSYTFVLEGAGGVQYLAGIAHDVTTERRQAEALESSLREKEALLKEIHHRVKNNLQIVSSLLNLHRPEGVDPQVRAFIEDSRNRIRSIALLHETLYQGDNLARIDFAKYVRSVTAHLQRALGSRLSGVGLEVEVGSVRVGIDQAIPCGLIINELVSNAFKYAFPEARSGTIRVGVEPAVGPGDAGEVRLSVADDGVGLGAPVDPRTGTSLGLRLVNDLTAQLGGTIAFSSPPGGGTTVEIRFRSV